MKAKQWISIFLLAAFLCAFAAAGMAAGTLVLPENLTEIKAEAFEGNTSLSEVVLPEGIETIGSRAFADSSIASINLPSSITYIADDAFEGCGYFELDVLEGCYAHNWAKKNGYVYTAVSDFTYTLSNNACRIDSYIGKEEEIVIPPVIDGYLVTGIKAGAFKNNTALKTVVLPNALATIGYEAFRDCTNLSYVEFPDGSLTSISYSAFRDCDSLLSVDIYSSSDLSISNGSGGTFYGCDRLKDVCIESRGKLSLNWAAFSECVALESVELISELSSVIEGNVFYGCTSLREVELPDTLTSIGYSAFEGCSALENIILPDSLKTIGYEAFRDCTNLSYVEFPDGSLTNISYSAFRDCDSLLSVDIYSSSDLSISNGSGGTFYGCDRLKDVCIESRGKLSLNWAAFSECVALESVELISELSSVIEGNVFYGCTSLREVELPDTLTSIGYSAFEGCSALENIILPDSLKTIGYEAFRDCTNLSYVEFPGGSLTSISYSAFRDCDALQSVKIYSYEDLSIGGSSGTFYGCDNLTEVVIGCAGTLNIQYGAFADCIKLRSAKFFGGTGAVFDNYVFDSCEELESIIFPKTLSSIGGYSFRDCSSLKQIVFPTSLKTIGNYLFQNCSSLLDVYIPESVETIGNYAFKNCSSEVTIHGVSGSYAETYAIEKGIAFVEDKIPAQSESLPTLLNFVLNTIITELTVPVGSQLVFGGTINAGSAPLMAVQASVFLASDHEQGAVYERAESVGADTFDLSGLSPMTVGAEYNGFAMTAGNSYDVVLYVTDENGNGFESDPSIRVNVVEVAEHEHMPSTTEAATYLFHVYDTIDGDNQNHNVSAIMWDVPCAVCGEVYMYKDEVGYEGDYVPRTEEHTYSVDGYCTACGYVCVHDFIDTGEEKKYTGIWKDCGDGTHERLSLMKYFECTDCGMRELRRVVEEDFIPEDHLLNTEERYISVAKLPDDDSKRVLQHQVTVEKWEYCETRAYGCTYKNLLSTEVRNVEHQFVDGVCECGYVQEVISSREDLLEGVNWELVYYVEHIVEDDTQFASAIGNLFNRGVDEVLGYLWNIANFDVFGLVEHIWEDVNYAYREEAAMNIIESLAGHGNTDDDITNIFYLLAASIKADVAVSSDARDILKKGLDAWGPEINADDVLKKINVINKTTTLIADLIEDASLNADQKATITLLLSDYSANHDYLTSEMNAFKNANDTEMHKIYSIAVEKLDEVYRESARNYIKNPAECLSFETFISGVELALAAKNKNPVKIGLEKLSKATGGSKELPHGANVLLFFHTLTSFFAGEVFGGNDIYDAQQKMYDNLTVLEPMQKQLLSAKQVYINDSSETNMNTLVKRVVSVANYKQMTLDNVWQYRDAQWFTSVSESSINREKSNLAIYAEGVTAISNGQAYEPENAVPAANGVKHGEMCPVCALK